MNSALKRYSTILQGKERAKFQLAKTSGLLDKKIREAEKVLESCELCERKCKMNRKKGGLGFCRVSDTPEISSIFPHFGEELFLAPSLTIFFISCTFSCVYCQNWAISQRYESGKTYSVKELAETIDKDPRCKNVNFVGGEPTPNLPFILKTLKQVKSNIPVVWNSNFYMSEKSMNLLSEVVDIYLSDWKYWTDECAEKLSKAPNYRAVVKRNHDLAFRDSELVIRHLVLPNHFKCCTKPILEYIAKNYGKRVVVNLMNQYRPEYKASEYPDINHRVTSQEMERVINLARELNLNFIT